MACRLLYWHIGNCKPPSPQKGNEMILGVDVRSSAVETCCLLRREKKLEYREERREEERERIVQHAERHTQSAKKKHTARSVKRTAQKIEQLTTNNHQRK